MNPRIPPNDTDAEESVLSVMLYDAETIPAAAGILRAEDFYRPSNAEIFSALTALHGSGTPVDAMTLKTELTKRGTLEQVGGAARIIEIAAGFYTSVNLKHHAMEIRRLSERRMLLKSISELMRNPDGLTVEVVEAIARDAKENQYIRTYTDKSTQRIDDFKNNLRVKKQRVKTGFSDFDAITGGFRIPSVAMVGAYPSVGKTAFALNIAARQEKPVVFFSLEMSAEMIYERLAAQKLKIDYHLFTEQRLTENQYCEVESFTDALKKHSFHVFDDAYHIEQQAAVIAGIKPCLVVVDYIQKVRTHRKTESRRIEIDHISGLYKQIAKENNCVILLLSQLTRPSKQEKNVKPTMASLKESGALEADGDYIGILHRPYVLHKDSPDTIKPEDGYILIDKNKFGNTGQIGLRFDGRYQKFYENEHSPALREPSLYNESQPVEDDELPFPV